MTAPSANTLLRTNHATPPGCDLVVASIVLGLGERSRAKEGLPAEVSTSHRPGHVVPHDEGAQLGDLHRRSRPPPCNKARAHRRAHLRVRAEDTTRPTSSPTRGVSRRLPPSPLRARCRPAQRLRGCKQLPAPPLREADTFANRDQSTAMTPSRRDTHTHTHKLAPRTGIGPETPAHLCGKPARSATAADWRPPRGRTRHTHRRAPRCARSGPHGRRAALSCSSTRETRASCRRSSRWLRSLKIRIELCDGPLHLLPRPLPLRRHCASNLCSNRLTSHIAASWASALRSRDSRKPEAVLASPSPRLPER